MISLVKNEGWYKGVVLCTVQCIVVINANIYKDNNNAGGGYTSLDNID